MGDAATGLWPQYDRDVLEALPRIAAAGNLGAVEPHESISKLERSFTAALGGGAAAFYNSGTSALSAALAGLQLKKRSEVIVPVSTFRSTVTPLLQLGLRPAVAACGPDMLISPDSVARLVSRETSAIVVNHQWGMPADMIAIGQIASKYGLAVVEDCSHAHASRLDGRPVGTFGDAAFFSCGTTKMVSGGLGGILWSASQSVFERAICFGLAKEVVMGRVSDKNLAQVASVGLGVNLRGHPLAAELAHSHMAKLSEIADRKDRNLASLDRVMAEFFAAAIPFPRPGRWSAGTWYKRPYRLPDMASASDAIRRGRAVGLRLEASPTNVDELLDRLSAGLDATGADYAIDAGYRAGTGGGCDFRSVVLHDTRDMYLDVDWDQIDSELRGQAGL